MDPNRKITKKFTKKFDSKVINRQYFHGKTGLYSLLNFRIKSYKVNLLMKNILIIDGPFKHKLHAWLGKY